VFGVAIRGKKNLSGVQVTTKNDSPFHEPRRSGGSAERRHSNTSQYAALYRDAATVHGPDARPQLDVEAHQEPALAVGRDAFHRVPISPVRSLRRGGTRPYQVVGDGG
jgi:hypothetical protein